MARIDQSPEASTAPAAPSARRRRGAWAAVLAIALVSGSALVAVPAIASDDAPPESDRVVVCTSGVVDQGGILTSSAVATRVADGETPALPDGCEER